MLPRARTALKFLLITVLLAGPATAQSDYVVVDVEVVGNRIATTSLILGVTSIAKGSPLTPTMIQNSLHRLYGLSIFSDVSLEAEEVAGGLKVYVIVKELPKLIELNFSGNKKIKTKDFDEKLGLGVGGYISPYLIHNTKEGILGMYAEKGYFQAQVEWTLEYRADSTEAILEYMIDERSKVKVENVVLTGNVRVKADDLIKKMRNHKRGFLRSSDFAKDKYQEDLDKVVEEYHKKGFIDAFLISDSIAIDTALNRMTIYLEVYEGPKYYFGTTEFINNEVLETRFLEKALKFKEGNVFNTDSFDESLFEIYSLYQEIGHLNVRVLPGRTTRADSLIDISYTISEGLPSHINLVHIIGNTKTKDKVIRREMSTRPGQVFNRSLLIRSIRDIMALNFFANVEPVPLDLPSGDVDIEFKIEEKQTGQLNAGAGYNSQDKLVGSFGMGIPNLAGNGQSLSFNVDFGSRRNSFSVSFTEPWLFGRPTLFGADVFAINRRWYDDYTEGRQGGSIRLGRRLRWPDNYFRLYTSYRLERNRFYDYDEEFEELNSFKTRYYFHWTELDTTGDTVSVVRRSDSLIVPGEQYSGSIVAYKEEWKTSSRFTFTIERDSRNLPEFATKGSVLSYTYSNTGGLLGGFWKYQRHRISVGKFLPLFWKLSLAAKVEYGMVVGSSNDPQDMHILVTDRFNPGGTAFDGIVRGYDDGSLTPDSIVSNSDPIHYYYDNPDSVDITVDSPDTTITDPSFKTRIRGKYMLVSNWELQLPIMERQIYGLLFFDAGNSWLHLHDIKPVTGLYKGWGFGFRILVPGIGTIGFDFARPLDDPPDGDDRSWRPHFQVGTTFR